MKLPLIAYINLIFYGVPITLGIVRHVWREKDSRLVFAFVILTTSTDIASFILGRFGINNYILSHLCGICEILLIALVFILWQKNPFWKKMLYLVIIINPDLSQRKIVI